MALTQKITELALIFEEQTFKVTVYCNQLWSLSAATVCWLASMYDGSAETAQPPQSNTIRQRFYAVPLQKYDANTALEFS